MTEKVCHQGAGHCHNILAKAVQKAATSRADFTDPNCATVSLASTFYVGNRTLVVGQVRHARVTRFLGNQGNREEDRPGIVRRKGAMVFV